VTSHGHDAQPATTSGRPNRRRLQYRLRTLLLAMTLAGVALGSWLAYVRPYRVQARAAEKLRALGAKVETRPGAPGWLCRLFGEEHFLDVVAVQLEHCRFKADDLAALEDLPRLERLYLAATDLDDKGLSHLRRLKRLKRLSLWKTRVTDKGAEHLAGLAELEVLDVHQTELTEGMLVHVAGMTRLERLVFSFPVTDEGLRRLAALPQRCRSEIERLSCVGVTDAGLGCLERLPKLAVVEINSPHVSDEGLAHVAALGGLRELRLVGTQVTDAGLDTVRRLPACRSLMLVNSRTTPAGILARFGRLFTWATFSGEGAYMRGPKMIVDYYGPVSDADLAHVREAPDLEKVGIGGPGLTEAALVHLAGLKRLEELSVGLPLTDAGLAHVGRLTGLRELGIGGRQDLPARGMCHLHELRQLERLSLSGVGLTDDRMAFLEGLPGLRELRLGANPIVGPGMAHVAGLENLQRISLTDCVRFTNSGLVHLKGLSNLNYLSIQYTQVTDEGLEHLYDLPKLCQVLMLGSKVTKGGRVRLSKALGLSEVLF